MTDPTPAIPGPLDIGDVLEIFVRDECAPAEAPVRGELIGTADELVSAFALTLVASPQTQRTYDRACRAFTAWLGSLAGPEDLTAANVAAYHAELVRSGRASSTVKKERAALNTFLRWLVEFEHISTLQARQALAVKLPRAQQAGREAPKALSSAQYGDLLRAAKAAIAGDALAGARDLAIVLVLGDAGLRCEELAGLRRVDFVATRKGAKLRALEVRHGKGDRGRTVKLSERASRAIVRWERGRVAVLGAPAHNAALFITLGRRKADDTYTSVGRRCGQPVLAAVIKRLGATAKIPAELRHPHALRHTCATELLRTGANIADVRTLLGHASIKTTSIYLASDEQRQEDVITRRERGGLVLDEDRDYAA
jgi:site-specific recombinase XerD